MVPLFSQLLSFSFWPKKSSDPVGSPPQREAATTQTFESGLADFVAEREQQAQGHGGKCWVSRGSRVVQL